MDQNVVDLKYSGFEEVTIGEFFNETFQVFYYEIDLLKEAGYTSCDEVEFTLSYKNLYNYTFKADMDDREYTLWCTYMPKNIQSYQDYIKSISHLKAIDSINVNPNINSIKLNLCFLIETKKLKTKQGEGISFYIAYDRFTVS